MAADVGEPAPLTPAETLSLLRAPLAGASSTLLAVSGGPDSVALMHLAAAAAGLAAGLAQPLAPFIVATVDHGLRPEAEAESAAVALQAQALGLEAHRLVWRGAKPSHGLQQAAREARYGLLSDLARQRGASHLVTAHTLDDQAETVMFRLARGSGSAGLAGMRPSAARGALVHVRPFLTIPKARLVAACRQGAWIFHQDPSNHDIRFARARWRKLLPALAEEGLTAPRLAIFARRMQRQRQAIEAAADIAARDAGLEGGPGLRIFALDRLLVQPQEILIRVIEQSLTDFARRGPPRLERLEALVEALVETQGARRAFKRTLHGAILAVLPGGLLEIRPEPLRRRGLARLFPSLLAEDE